MQVGLVDASVQKAELFGDSTGAEGKEGEEGKEQKRAADSDTQPQEDKKAQ